MSRMFVYGTLKQGEVNHRHLLGQEFLGKSRTKNPDYCMEVRGAPAVFVSKPGWYIGGEVYEVDASALYRIDALEGHPWWYKRELIEIEDIGWCWMYLIQPRQPMYHYPDGAILSY